MAFKLGALSDANSVQDMGEIQEGNPAHDSSIMPTQESQVLSGCDDTNNAADSVSKGPKWYDQTSEFDITVQASFIGFCIQTLMCVGKWESMVDISNRLNTATDNTFASQLLPFIIFA